MYNHLLAYTRNFISNNYHISLENFCLFVYTMVFNYSFFEMTYTGQTMYALNLWNFIKHQTFIMNSTHRLHKDTKAIKVNMLG